MARDDPQFNVRMPAEMKAVLEERAKAAQRSLNGEIVSRLRASLEAEGMLEPVDPADPLVPVLKAVGEIGRQERIIQAAVARVRGEEEQ